MIFHFFVFVSLVHIECSHFLIPLFVCLFVLLGFFSFFFLFIFSVCFFISYCYFGFVVIICLGFGVSVFFLPFFSVCVSVVLLLLSVFGFAFCLGFCLSVCVLFFFLPFLYFLATLHSLQALGCPTRGQTWASRVGVQSPGLQTAREFLGPGSINWHALSQRYPTQLQDLAPPNCLQVPVLDASHQTTSKTGTQPHPLSHRLPKPILSSQTPQNPSPDAALPIRRKRLSSTQQSAGNSPSHQEAYRSLWTTRGQTTEARRTMTLQPVERRP